MADQAFTERTGSSATREKSAADQASSAGEKLRDQASDFASSSGEAIREKASEFADAAKEAGSDAADRFKEMVETQKDAGARYVGGIAEAMRRAAGEFDNDLPIAGTCLRKAASQVDAVSDSVRNGDVNDLLREAQEFARKQPSVFLGMTVLAGFGIVRFLKSSNENSSGTNSNVSQPMRQ